jgi:xanthine dehydrogenase YagS FAD-binding subunit
VTVKAGKIADARLVLSGVAPTPWRLPAVEKLLVGQKLDAKLIARAADAAIAGAKPLEHNGYKVPLVHGLIEEVLGGIPAA